MTETTLFDGLRFLSDDLRGWPRAWAVLAHRYGDAACRHPVAGEVWQYMGTSGGWHEFRHRALPVELLERAVGCEGWGGPIGPGDCGGWRVYDRVRAESGDFELAPRRDLTEDARPR